MYQQNITKARSSDPNIPVIQSQLTQSYDLRKHKTMSPAWEELLLVPEPYEKILEQDSVVVFEVNYITEYESLFNLFIGCIIISEWLPQRHKVRTPTL